MSECTPRKSREAAGRPATYRPEFCQQLVAHMCAGLSFESFAGVLGVGQEVLARWLLEHR